MLRMERYQAPLRRLRMENNTLADFLYVTNRIWMGTPSKRLRVGALGGNGLSQTPLTRGPW